MCRSTAACRSPPDTGPPDTGPPDTGLAGAGPPDARGAAGPRGALPWTRPVHLPFLWIYGRRDETISVMGANIYPEDVERLIYRDPQLAPVIHSFCLAVLTDASGTPRPGIMLELESGATAGEDWPERLAVQFQDGLVDLNLDVRSAVREFPAAMLPLVSFYPPGAGPFAADASRIKQRRISKAPR